MTPQDDARKKALALYEGDPDAGLTIEQIAAEIAALSQQGAGIAGTVEAALHRAFLRGQMGPLQPAPVGGDECHCLSVSADGAKHRDIKRTINCPVCGPKFRALSSPPADEEQAEALAALEVMKKRAYSHADISNSPQHMREWIDSDADKIRRAILAPPADQLQYLVKHSYKFDKNGDPYKVDAPAVNTIPPQTIDKDRCEQSGIDRGLREATPKDVVFAAMESGFMLSTAHGQKAGRLVPVSDEGTLMSFFKAMLAACGGE